MLRSASASACSVCRRAPGLLVGGDQGRDPGRRGRTHVFAAGVQQQAARRQLREGDDTPGHAGEIQRRRRLPQGPGVRGGRGAIGADAGEDRRAELHQKRGQALGQVRLRRRPARLPAQRRRDRDHPGIAQAREDPDVGRRKQIGERGQESLGALGIVELDGDRRPHADDAVGLALIEVARRFEEPLDPPVGLVVAGEQNVEEAGAEVAFGGLDQAGVGYIVRRHHRADDIGVFDGEIGDRVDCLAARFADTRSLPRLSASATSRGVRIDRRAASPRAESAVPRAGVREP